MEVALDPAPGGVARLDDALARGAELLEARAEVGLEALVVERQRGARRSRLHQLGRGVDVGRVDDGREPATSPVDRGPCSTRPRLRQLHAGARLVDEHAAVGKPVRDAERSVAEALGEHLAHGAAGGRSREEERAHEPTQRRRECLEHGDRHDRRRDGEQAEHHAQPGLERERPHEAVRARRGNAVDSEPEQRERERDGREPGDRGRERHRQLGRREREAAGEAGAGHSLAHAANARTRGRLLGKRRDARREQPVAERALERGEAPDDVGRPDQHRRADSQRHEQRSDQPGEQDEYEIGDGERKAHDHVEGRARGDLQALLERSRPHGAPFTVTSPVVDWAEMPKGAESSDDSPLTFCVPVSEFTASR